MYLFNMQSYTSIVLLNYVSKNKWSWNYFSFKLSVPFLIWVFMLNNICIANIRFITIHKSTHWLMLRKCTQLYNISKNITMLSPMMNLSCLGKAHLYCFYIYFKYSQELPIRWCVCIEKIHTFVLLCCTIYPEWNFTHKTQISVSVVLISYNVG